MDPAALLARATAWAAADPDPLTAAEVRGLVTAGDLPALEERFGASLEFGTAGLRGLLGGGTNRMNRAVVRRTTAGLARYLKAQVPDAARRGVVVGRDARTGSEAFTREVAGVLAAEGLPAHVVDGVAPTPVTAFACLELGAAAAVMVTASHNPREYNGYKVYWGNGAQIIPPHDAGIARAIEAVEDAARVPVLAEAAARARGLWRDVPAWLERRYLDAILALRPTRSSGRLPIVYTALHGVGGRWALQALREAGFTQVHPVPEQLAPDGAFPTVRFPNPEEPGALDLARALAEQLGAPLVLANDPDADRLAVMARDAHGALRPLTGDEVGVLLAHFILTQGAPAPALVVTTIVSSAQLKGLAAELGARCEETLTGFKWIANRALELEAQGARFAFGYEEALGYTVGTVVRDKDGVSAAVVMADLAAWCHARGTTVLGHLEDLQRRFGLFVGVQHNATLAGPGGAATIRAVLEGFRARPLTALGPHRVVAVNDYQAQLRTAGGVERPLALPPSNVLAWELEGGGRVTLRPSGTEPKLKVYLELKEAPAPGEALATARTRGQARLEALKEAFLAEARTRGLP
jgi:phosphomannomutase